MTPFDSEVDAAARLLKHLGYSPRRFKFEHISIDPMDTFYALRYTVSVTSDGRTKKYDGGHLLNWLELFEYDLRNGVFGAV